METQALDKTQLEALEIVRVVAPRAASVLEAQPRDTAAVKALTAFQSNPKAWGLLLLGGVGAGKSTAAAKALFDYATAQARQQAELWTGTHEWVRVADAARASGFGDDAEKRIRRWRKAGLLVIDDLGVEMTTAPWLQALDDVLDSRYEHCRRTVITSNLSADAFKLRYGARAADRFRANGMVVVLDDKSMRGAA